MTKFVTGQSAPVRYLDVFLALGLLGLLLFEALPRVFDAAGLFDPVPYRDVKILAVERPPEPGAPNEGNLAAVHIVAGYTKGSEGCQIINAVAIGLALGEATPLAWEPYRGPNVAFERTPGRQRLDWTVWVNDQIYDQIEIRTRHDCGGERVDKTMLTVDVPNGDPDAPDP